MLNLKIFWLQLQMWLENPKAELTLENSLVEIDAPYNRYITHS